MAMSVHSLILQICAHHWSGPLPAACKMPVVGDTSALHKMTCVALGLLRFASQVDKEGILLVPRFSDRFG